MTLGRIATYLLIAVVALLALATAGVMAFVTGSIIRWSDAYEAMDSADSLRAAVAPGSERLRLANARVEGEPPEGMPVDRRLHRAPTLARLRYEAIAETGEVVGATEVRALVPPLPYFGADAPKGAFGRTECAPACVEQLGRSGAVLLERSGQAGIADEWVLRMPVGRPFDLGRRSLAIQDFQERSARTVPDSRLRVTLLEACQARVRAGAVTNLEFYPYAMVPIPQEFRTRRWVQLEGCPTLTGPLTAERQAWPPPAAAPERALAALATWSAGPEIDAPYGFEAIRVTRHGPLGEASLVVDEDWVAARGQPLLFRLRRVCRYDPGTNSWAPLPFAQADLEIALRTELQGGVHPALRVAYRFPQDAGLFWAEWTEADADVPEIVRVHVVRIPTGPAPACSKGNLPVPAPGEIVVCVPGGAGAEVRAVPDPERDCAP